MKLVGVIVLLCSLYWTWHLFHGNSASIPESVHIQLQEDLQRELAKIITKGNPEVSSVRIEKFWTRTLDSKRIRAFFEIGYTDTGAEVEVEVLKKGKTDLILSREEESTQYWNAESLSIDGQLIKFEEGITLSPTQVN